MATIKDVAKLAGVAISTASNALNGKYGVSLQTKKRVLAAAKELNFVPNKMAQGLITKSTGNICVALSGPSSFNIFTNPVFFDVIRTITSTLNKSGYHTLLNIVNMEEEDTVIPKIAQSRSMDALIYIGTRKSDLELEKLIERIQVPVVVLICSAPNKEVFAVSLNNEKCGYMAAKYLIEMGHEKIGFVGDLPGSSMAGQRLSGFKKALAEKGIKYDSSLVVSGDYYQESGLIGVRQLLRQSSSRPTAIFAANDLMALGVIEGLEQEGFRIPEDISIIGCDNIPNLHLLKVPLTTIANPFSEVGRLGAQKVIEILEGKKGLADQIILDSELRLRSSVIKV